MTNVIQIRHLRFRYDNKGPWVLDLKSFEMKAGEKVFLLGPSGSGKSTFLELISGVLPATEAEQLEVCGQNLQKLSASDKDGFRGSHVGYIFQSFNLIPYLDVRSNIALPAQLSVARASRLKAPLQREVERLAEAVGLGAMLSRPVTQLSVGQQQRVAAARALLGSPELILADEPTSALDQDARERFIQLLFSCCQESGASVLFVSHDRTLQPLFDRSLSLKDLNLGGV